MFRELLKEASGKCSGGSDMPYFTVSDEAARASAGRAFLVRFSGFDGGRDVHQ